MLSNAYFLPKFRFDTAENEPAKNLQNFANFPNYRLAAEAAGRNAPDGHPLRRQVRQALGAEVLPTAPRRRRTDAEAMHLRGVALFSSKCPTHVQSRFSILHEFLCDTHDKLLREVTRL